MGSRIDRQIAMLPGVRASVRAAAGRIEATAKALAAGHGGLSGDISIESPTVYDYDVVMTHEAALSIETGHQDKVFGSGWVPGLHIMRDAARINS